MIPDTPHRSAPAVYDANQRHAIASHSTWVSVGVNVMLTMVQVGAGLLAHSQALIADGVHSLSDLLSDFLVLIASYHSKAPADAGHPYGHERVETVASFLLGAILVATGIGIMVGAALKLENMHAAAPVTSLALWTAGLALVAKESLFRYMLHVGEKLRSPLLIANAWHARSDAASSLVVAIGIGANMLGFLYADALAAIVVGFMIVRMGIVFAWDAFQELIDAGLSIEEVNSIRQTIIDTPGVESLHELKTRRMAHRVLVEAHILVDAHISVSEGHNIAERARSRLLAAHEAIDNVLVHVDPEDDLDHDRNAIRVPGRPELLQALGQLMEGMPLPERVVFHYLNGRVEAEVFLPYAMFKDETTLRQMQDMLNQRMGNHDMFRAITLCAALAQNAS
jgi:cation diffusion facilitator family transporter